MKTIPVIDLAPFLDASDKTGVARSVSKACQEIGFFTIKNHGIKLETIAAANEASTRFFDLPVQIKEAASLDGGIGYIGSAGERLAASLDDAIVVDRKESLNLTLPVQTPMWPTTGSAEIETYYNHLLNLSHSLMQLFALALDLPETWFDDKIDRPRSILRLLNYPAVEASTLPVSRAGAHTDYGTLTILWSPDSRGLQAKNRQGDWVDIIAPPDHLIINIGDLMMNWTNDKWLSTLHRVLRQPGAAAPRRQSIAFFHNPNPDALITCIDSCHSAEDPPKYVPILAKEHLQMKIAKALGKDVKL